MTPHDWKVVESGRLYCTPPIASMQQDTDWVCYRCGTRAVRTRSGKGPPRPIIKNEDCDLTIVQEIHES